MVIDDLHNFSLFNAIDGLICLIVVHQDKFFLVHINQITPGDHPCIAIIFRHNREISDSFFHHDILDIIHITVFFKNHQILFCHKVRNREALIDQSCYCICIISRTDDRASIVSGNFSDCS